MCYIYELIKGLIVEDRLTVSMKPQLDSDYARQLRGTKVADFIEKQVETRCLPHYPGNKLPIYFENRKKYILDQMELGEHLMNRDCLGIFFLLHSISLNFKFNVVNVDEFISIRMYLSSCSTF